jgi:hypothetical protein
VLVVGVQIFGAVTLEYFGLALLIGLTSGAYSSIFIASPLLAMFKEHEERYRRIRERLESRGTAMQLISPAAVAAGALSGPETTTAVKRRRTSGSAQARPSTLRPSASKPAAVVVDVGEEFEDEEVAGFDHDVDLEQDGSASLGGQRGASTPSAGPAKRPTQAPRAGTPARRPPPRPRKKGRRR